MEPLANLDELKARLEWVLTPDEERVALSDLEDASDLARAYGKPWFDAASAPRLVRTTVLAAVVRHRRNPDGYTTSRAGDETLNWTDRGEGSGSVTFTEKEIKLLGSLAGRTGIVSVPLTAWGPMNQQAQGFVPVVGEKPFPLFGSDVSPW